MANLYDANANWSSRSNDERYTSLFDMRDHFDDMRQKSASKVYKLSDLSFVADAENNNKLSVVGPSGNPALINGYGFESLTVLAKAPKGFLSSLPNKLTADVLNHKLKDNHDEIGMLMTQESKKTPIVMRAATTPNYGRIWNSQVLNALTHKFGDGVTGDWHVPGEFGKPVPVTQKNTTLYAGEQDMFVFLCDESHTLEINNRRDDKPGMLSRGFFVVNSEVGTQPLRFTTFLYDYVCANRIIWGAQEINTITIKHTLNAPERWLESIAPTLQDYANGKASETEQVLKLAQTMTIGQTLDDTYDFLETHFGTRKIAKAINKAHLDDEGRDITTLWDAVTGVTAYARNMPFQNERVLIEAKAGKLLDMAKEAA